MKAHKIATTGWTEYFLKINGTTAVKLSQTQPPNSNPSVENVPFLPMPLLPVPFLSDAGIVFHLSKSIYITNYQIYYKLNTLHKSNALTPRPRLLP